MCCGPCGSLGRVLSQCPEAAAAVVPGEHGEHKIKIAVDKGDGGSKGPGDESDSHIIADSKKKSESTVEGAMSQAKVCMGCSAVVWLRRVSVNPIVGFRIDVCTAAATTSALASSF